MTALPAGALSLELPAAATPLAEEISPMDSYALPLGPFQDGAVPVQPLEGEITRQSWQIAAQGLTSLQLFAPLREQLLTEGYTLLFECGGEACGGFDFRFATEVLPAPDMHVDLTDFRFLAARRGKDMHLTLLVSRTENAGFVQMIRVAQTPARAGVPTVQIATPTALPDTDLSAQLSQFGHVVLSDLAFETGSSALSGGPFASLQALAAFLRADPSRRVALVGHTDTVGTLENNVALSKRRAAAVLERLATAHDVPRAQMEAQGMGYLSPVAPNQTDAGREANRRVEVVLLNTE
ncbi:OmpA family protein [Thalassobius sp. S69A]|uniref:OmpA family protein n=1 Tax=unclassified Thalassovita TaxID=2619711 RepID=UPI003C7EA893